MKNPFTRKRTEENTAVSPEQAKFVSRLKLSINQKFAEVLASKSKTADGQQQDHKRKKEDDPAFITLLDATTVTNYVRSIFVKKLDFVPKQVEAALVLSEATVAPTTIQKVKMFKRAVGLVGGLGGIGTIAMSIMVGLGVGTTATVPTMWATVVAWFTTTTTTTTMPYLWPITIGLAGAGVAAFAIYFSASGSSAERAEKFKNALINSSEKAVAEIWKEYGDKLS